MPTMEVDIWDATISLAPGQDPYWYWQVTSWEYVNITIIPISSNGDVQISNLRVTSDPQGSRTWHFTLTNNTDETLSCFLTATVPHDSVD